MFGKIVQLLGITMSDEFEITYGIEGVNYHEKLFYDLPFGRVTFANMNPDVTKKYIHDRGYRIAGLGDGFKEVLIFNGLLTPKDKEEFLILIVPEAFKIKTNAKKIAGRFSYEGIYKMHAGDIVKITKGCYKSIEHTYMAVQAGNEIFLVEKTR